MGIRWSRKVYKRTCKIRDMSVYVNASLLSRSRWERAPIDRAEYRRTFGLRAQLCPWCPDSHEKLLSADRCVQMSATAIWICTRRRQVFRTRYAVTIYETFKPMALHGCGFCWMSVCQVPLRFKEIEMFLRKTNFCRGDIRDFHSPLFNFSLNIDSHNSLKIGWTKIYNF